MGRFDCLYFLEDVALQIATPGVKRLDSKNSLSSTKIYYEDEDIGFSGCGANQNRFIGSAVSSHATKLN
jgi:hypothetical protein